MKFIKINKCLPGRKFKLKRDDKETYVVEKCFDAVIMCRGIISGLPELVDPNCRVFVKSRHDKKNWYER